MAANAEGFLLGGFQDQLMASPDGRAWTAQKLGAPGEGAITRLNLAGPHAIALRSVSREENGWGINSSEICLRDPKSGIWRKVAALDGGARDVPLDQLDWTGDRWLARGQSVILTVTANGATETFHPEPPAGDVYAPMGGDEVLVKAGDHWRMYLFSGVIESDDLTNWRIVKSYSPDGVDGRWFVGADGAAQWYGVIGTARKPGPLSWSQVVAALEKPKPVPVAVVAAKPAAKQFTDAELVVPLKADEIEKEPKTGLEFFNRGVARFKNYDRKGAIPDFKRSAELGVTAGGVNFARLVLHESRPVLRANFFDAVSFWYFAVEDGYKDIVEDNRHDPNLDLAMVMLQGGDWVAARESFEKAAKAGDRFTKVILGEMYLQGLSVPYDLDKAKQLFEEADTEEHPSTWAAMRLDAIAQGKTYVQVILENNQNRERMQRIGAAIKGGFTPLPAATEIPTQAVIDATIKRSPWTYAQIAEALKKQVNYEALAVAIRTDGGDFYAGEIDRLRAMPEMAGQQDTWLIDALVGDDKPGAGPWAREMAQAAIATRRAQQTAPVQWADSLDLRRRAAQGDLTALYQVYTLNAEKRLPLGGLPPVIADQLKTLPQRAVAENFAPALWLVAEGLEHNPDKSKNDLALAAEYCRASALAGEAEAAWKLANLYFAGPDYDTKQEGVADNFLAAEHWYIEAGALARPGQKVGYQSPEDCLYLLYSFRKPIGGQAFEMDTQPDSLRWARELLRRGGQVAENTKIALASLQASHPGANVEKLMADLPPEVPAFTAEQLAAMEQAATAGDAAVALQLGDAYATGRGVLQDDVVANHWFERAAELGDVTAMRRLVQQYTTGCGVKVDIAQQRAWLRRAAEAGDVSAWTALGAISEGADRIAAFQKGADAGDTEAMLGLADTWQYGRGGVEKDEAKFIEAAKRAAEAGSLEAMVRLGYYYNSGYPQKDPAAALQWYRRAVDAGDKTQRMMLAALYIGAKDKAAAEKLYLEMAEEGDVAAQSKLGSLLYYNGREEEGIAWLRKVANSPATNEQALVAAQVKRYDEEEKAAPGSIPWLERRSRRGDADAKFELGRKLYASQQPGAWGTLRAAAESGHAKATAMFYAIALADKDTDKAWLTKWLEERVAANNSQAILIEGQLLSKTNLAEALKRIERAAELGNVEAKFQLGMAKYQGQQVAQDRAGGIALITAAAEGDFPLAQFTLGKALLAGDNGLPADPKRGVALLEKAAAQDWQPPVTMQALVLLGQVYESGKVASIAKNLGKALEYYDRASKLDPRNAQLTQHMNVLRQQYSLEMKMGGRM